MRKSIGNGVMGALLALALLAMPATAEPVTIKVGISASRTHIIGKMSYLMGQQIQKGLPGRVDWQVFEGGQLGTESEMIEGLMQGTHMIGMDGGWFQNIEPDFALFDTPFLFQNRDQARRVIAAVQDDLARAILKKGIVLIGIGDLGFREISNNVRPIVTPADLKGIKLRVPGNPYSLQTFQMLGANPTPMDAGMLYLALREGVVDGQENPLASIWSLKYHEVQKYISMSNHVFAPIFIGVSARYWNSWPPDVQAAVREAAQAACDYSFDQDALAENTLKARIQKANPQIRFNEVDTAAFEKAAAPIIEARHRKISPEVWNRAMVAMQQYKTVALKAP